MVQYYIKLLSGMEVIFHWGMLYLGYLVKTIYVIFGVKLSVIENQIYTLPTLVTVPHYAVTDYD